MSWLVGTLRGLESRIDAAIGVPPEVTAQQSPLNKFQKEQQQQQQQQQLRQQEQQQEQEHIERERQQEQPEAQQEAYPAHLAAGGAPREARDAKKNDDISRAQPRRSIQPRSNSFSAKTPVSAPAQKSSSSATSSNLGFLTPTDVSNRLSAWLSPTQQVSTETVAPLSNEPVVGSGRLEMEGESSANADDVSTHSGSEGILVEDSTVVDKHADANETADESESVADSASGAEQEKEQDTEGGEQAESKAAVESFVHDSDTSPAVFVDSDASSAVQDTTREEIVLDVRPEEASDATITCRERTNIEPASLEDSASLGDPFESEASEPARRRSDTGHSPCISSANNTSNADDDDVDVCVDSTPEEEVAGRSEENAAHSSEHPVARSPTADIAPPFMETQVESQALIAARNAIERLQLDLERERTGKSELQRALGQRDALLGEQKAEIAAIHDANEKLSRRIAQLDAEREQHNTPNRAVDTEMLLAEEKKRSATLLTEGEALQKKLQAREAAMKKMQAARAENEKLLQQSRDRATSSETVLAKKTERVKELEAELRRANDTISTLQAAVKKTRQQLDAVTAKADQAASQVQHLQATIDAVSHENAELTGVRQQFQETTEESDARRRAYDQEVQALQTAHDTSLEREAALQRQLSEARNALSRARERDAWREQQTQQELEELRERLAAEETRSESIRSAVPDSTRPLLRQIEALRESSKEREHVWEATEQQLRAEIELLKSNLDEIESSAVEREACARELEDKVASLEREASQLRATSARQAAALSDERKRAAAAEDLMASAQVRADDAEAGLEAAAADLSHTQSSVASLQEALTARERRVGELQKELRAIQERQRNLSQTLQDSESVSDGALSAVPSTDDLASVIGSLPGDRLHELLRQKDGELQSLHQQAVALQRRLDATNDQMIALESHNQDLRHEMTALSQVRDNLSQLNARHEAALGLIGEKEELIEELRADISDMKAVYRSQIEMLVEQLGQNSSKR